MLKRTKFLLVLLIFSTLASSLCFGSFAAPDDSTSGDTSVSDSSDPDDMPSDDPDDSEDEEEETGLSVKMGIVSGTGSSGIYIRSMPSKNGQVLYGVADGTELVIIANEGNWYRVGYYGYVGYASADYIIPYCESDCEFGAGTVTGSFVYMRYSPDSTIDNQMMVLREGTTVSIIGVEGGWYYVDYNANRGYIHADYLFPIKDEKVNFSSARVNVGSGVNLRTSTSTSAEVVTTLLYGEEVKVLSILNGWYKVEYKDDGKTYTGYIYSDYIVSSDEFVDVTASNGSSSGGSSSSGGGYSSEGQRIVNYATKFLGYPYVWGGYTPSMGFDCSGFTQYVFGQCGYTLNYRTQQYKNGTSVSYSNLRVGDLVFFDTYENGTIGHVGIYYGNGNFIHAANPSKGVCISSMAPGSYYYRVYSCARRIVW